jgi:hypothetical protein
MVEFDRDWKFGWEKNAQEKVGERKRVIVRNRLEGVATETIYTRLEVSVRKEERCGRM